MNLLLNILFSSFIQIILVSIIPVIWWFVASRKEIKLKEWLGFKKIKLYSRKKFFLTLSSTIILFMTFSVVLLYMLRDVTTAVSQFSGLGFRAILPVLLYSFVQTAFSEELFFRGFLNKRLIHKFGFVTGNTIQSICFGLLHGIMFSGNVSLDKTILVILFTGGIAWSMGCINEKSANGSIWPSWLIHGISNMFSSIISLFNLI